MEILNEKNFNEKIKNGVVLIDFFATWCGPCRMMAPILEQVQNELGEKVHIYKVDVDECENLARKYGIMSIPSLFLFVDGKETEHKVGLTQKDALTAWLAKYL